MSNSEKETILETGDVLLYINDGGDFLSTISRWATGRYSHVAMYLGKAWGDVPFLYESNGRGVSIQSLQPDKGRPVKVLRLLNCPTAGLVRQAVMLASDDKAYYDYHAIAWHCVPRVLKRKFPFLPIPPKYVRDKKMICSEAVAEVFWREGIDVLPRDIVPLPGDFETSPVLQAVYEGKLLEDPS